MRIAANEGNVWYIAARIRHPDLAAVGAAFGFMPKNVNNSRWLNPDSSLKQAVNRLGKIREMRVSRQMKAMFGILWRQTRTLIGRHCGTAFRLVPKNVNNSRRLNPGSSIKQDVNRFGPPGGYFSFINGRERKTCTNFKKAVF